MHRAPDLSSRWPTLGVAARRSRLLDGFRLRVPSLTSSLQAAAPRAARAWAGLWAQDASTWSQDSAVQKTIANRLGWLESPLLMAESIQRLQTFAASIKEAGFSHVVLLGMGGSSLAPEVLRSVVGVEPGWSRLHMLDSTDPAAV